MLLVGIYYVTDRVGVLFRSIHAVCHISAAEALVQVKALMKKMTALDPDFLHMPFEQKLLMSLSGVLYSDEWRSYDSEGMLSDCAYLVDMTYLNRYRLKTFEVREQQIILTLDILFHNAYWNGHFSHKDELLTVSILLDRTSSLNQAELTITDIRKR